jgi:hypothetical protein
VYIGGEFTMIFIVATLLFIVCTISTLTSVREEPLISSSHVDSETDNNDDDESPDNDIDEKRPLLSLRRQNTRIYSKQIKIEQLPANLFLSDLNNQEGFLEIDPGTGRLIPHDQTGQT